MGWPCPQRRSWRLLVWAPLPSFCARATPDTIWSRTQVMRALHEGKVDAGAVGSSTWLRELEQARVNDALVTSVWTSPGYSHCNFTALPDFDAGLAARWTRALLAMDY